MVMTNDTMPTKELLERLLRIEQKIGLGLMNLRIANGFFEDAKKQVCDLLEGAYGPLKMD